MGRINIIVLDSFGVGELPDAHEYGDEGSNTLEGIYNNYKLNLPNLKKLGFSRTKTLGYGNECCDFHFYKK